MHEFEKRTNTFPTAFSAVLARVDAINPIEYCATRNYINGAVTELSPYISRGIISTKFILSEILKKGYNPIEIEKFIQELAWRDYWQQVWIAKGNAINSDLKNQQQSVSQTSIPKAIVEANTGIEAIDEAILNFYETGYIHNHIRMYIASIACNIAQNKWKIPAKWMYYHLLDADWASNALSWQWVAGTNSNKKYYANQENINRFCFSEQKNTFLDIPYDSFNTLSIPEILKESAEVTLKTPLPTPKSLIINESVPTYIYNFYNLDPLWNSKTTANRILLLEPSHFDAYPISKHTIDFMLKISEENLEHIQVYVGEFNELMNTYNFGNVHYKEHPLNNHYQGIEEPRDWMFEVKGYFPSFFSFWKKCKKQLVS